MLFDGSLPGSYTEPAENSAAIWQGSWGLLLLGARGRGNWKPAANVRSGANLLDWVKSFRRRFAEGA